MDYGKIVLKGDILEADFENNTILIKSDSPIVVRKEKVIVISVEEHNALFKNSEIFDLIKLSKNLTKEL